MARPHQEAIDTFISITGASEAIAVQKLEEHGGDLNVAVNAHFSEGDRNAPANVREMPVGVQNDLMDIDDPVQIEQWPPLSHLPANPNSNPLSLLGPHFGRNIFDGVPAFTNPQPLVTHPREVRQIPIEVRDDNQPSGRSGNAPIIEDVTETVDTPIPEVHGTVIVDDEDEIPAGLAAAQRREQFDDMSNDGARDRFIGPPVPQFGDLQDTSNDIEEQMIRAAIEASRREVDESFPNEPFGAERDLNRPELQQRQPPLDDTELARAVSLSLKTAEQEKALRELERNSGGSSGVIKPEEVVELGNVAATNGRLEAGSSFIQDETEDLEEQPLVRHRSRRMSSGSVESAQEVGVVEASPPLSPRQPIRSTSPQRNGEAFQSDDWGGMSSLEHDEAVMLEAAMFGGIPEGTSYRFPYAAPHQFIQSEAPYPRPFPRPPSPSLTAQRLIREQQDDEYLASLQADREKEQKAKEEAEAREEEEKRREEESRRKLEEEQELERLLAAKEATLPQEPASDDENAVNLLVRMPDGSRRGRRFLKTNKLQSLFDFIDIGRAVKPGSYRLVRPYPRRAFEDGESALTLNELGLTSKQEALYLELI
ncbi:plant UBX domain-containing protein 8 [Humulus lupulus]|uniref:plant UBX domain-containing protein 8 n=1 Tax=Humulus lupulus TaxID=3486 RepID=UPI002B415C02|nr:plant UBX domain-containing protein 8 [Humulus lupulus]